jgi:DDE superfamily endonuclease
MGQPEGAVYDAKRRAHTAQGLAVSTIHGDLLWCDGGWPGNCHEHELLELSGLSAVLDATDVATIIDRGFRGWPSSASIGMRPSATGAQGSAQRRATGLQPPTGRAARAGGAGDRTPRQRVVAAPLARATVPSPGRVPGRWRADLPWPVAPPSTHVKASWTSSMNGPRALTALSVSTGHCCLLCSVTACWLQALSWRGRCALEA